MRGKVKAVCFLKLLDNRLLMKHDLSSFASLRSTGTSRILDKIHYLEQIAFTLNITLNVIKAI